jgi:hypothetical protein
MWSYFSPEVKLDVGLFFSRSEIKNEELFYFSREAAADGQSHHQAREDKCLADNK